ncbi:MAG: ATP-binding cassette domain-containing protein [Candidatus Bathyarchaeia archaeon]
MTLIELRDIVKKYGETVALNGVNLKVDEGDFLAVVGPNGAGKTTLLKIMAGIEEPTSGEVYYRNRKIGCGDLEFLRKRCTMVFQRTIVFNTTVYNNIAYGLKIRGIPKDEIQRRVHEALKLVKLEGFEKLSAKKLSGGQQQRVSLARALALKSELLLLDEPTANLDPQTTSLVEDLMDYINREGETTIVMATHNIFQVQKVPRRAALLLHGRVAEVGLVEEVFMKPTVNLASFARLENIFTGTATILTNGTSLINVNDKVQIEVAFKKKGETTILIRPEDIIVSKKPLESSARNTFKGRIVEVSDLGSVVRLKVDAGEIFTTQVTKLSFERMRLNMGSEVFISFKASSVHLV